MLVSNGKSASSDRQQSMPCEKLRALPNLSRVDLNSSLSSLAPNS